MFSTIVNYLLNHLDFTISLVFSMVFLVVNIIQAVKYKDKSKLKDALSELPKVICTIEEISKVKESLGSKPSSIEKKAMAEVFCKKTFGSIYTKNAKLIDDAIEDILSTPQKKGGSDDVSKENEER